MRRATLQVIIALFASAFAFSSASVCADDFATKALDGTPATLPSKEEEQNAVKEVTEQKPAQERPLMGDFPQPRDFGRPPEASTSPQTSSDQARAERKRLVDEWEASQGTAPAK